MLGPGACTRVGPFLHNIDPKITISGCVGIKVNITQGGSFCSSDFTLELKRFPGPWAMPDGDLMGKLALFVLHSEMWPQFGTAQTGGATVHGCSTLWC